MSKKKIIITIIAMFSVFAIVLTILLINKKPEVEDDSIDLANQNWAVNDVKEKDNSEISTVTEKNIGNVIFNQLDNLTYEQSADKETLMYKVKNNDEVALLESRHGDLIEVSILDTSTSGLTRIACTFLDEYVEDFILVYDDIQTHSYLNCQTVERWEHFHSDANKG